MTRELFPPEAFAPPSTRLVPQGYSAGFRFIDLFAGIGGIRMGLEAAGGRCVSTVECDRWAMQTYGANFGSTLGTTVVAEELPRDIFNVKASDLASYDVLAAGFPCQPFSIAGVSKNLSLGREHGFSHDKSGNLFFQIVRLILEAETPPPVLFLENVKNLTRHDGGNTFHVIRRNLRNLGYNLSWSVVNARPWVPQKRERTFIVGLHRDVFGERTFEFPRDLPAEPWPVMSAILDTSVDAKYTLTDHLWRYLQGYAAKHHRQGNGFGFGKVGPDDVARTLSARYHKDGSEILIETGSSTPRRLTPRECARLMGYPDTFVIPVSDTQAYRQFGNSVVVPVIKFLGDALVSQGVVIPSNALTA